MLHQGLFCSHQLRRQEFRVYHTETVMNHWTPWLLFGCWPSVRSCLQCVRTCSMNLISDIISFQCVCYLLVSLHVSSGVCVWESSRAIGKRQMDWTHLLVLSWLSHLISFFFFFTYIWVRCAANPLQYLYLLELKKCPYMDVGGAYMHGWLH